MIVRSRLLLLLWVFTISLVCSAQSVSAMKDLTGVDLLTRAVATCGGPNAVLGIQDLRATGSGVFYWAGAETTAPVTLRMKQGKLMRMDIDSDDVPRGWTLRNFKASSKAGSRITPLPSQNSASLKLIAVPLQQFASALTDSDASIGPAKQITVQNQTFLTVDIGRQFAKEQDRDGSFASLAGVVAYFDPATLMLAGIHGHQVGDPSDRLEYAYQLYFSDYRQIGGVCLPFKTSEWFGGQHTWVMQFTNAAVNVGLTDSELQF